MIWHQHKFYVMKRRNDSKHVPVFLLSLNRDLKGVVFSDPANGILCAMVEHENYIVAGPFDSGYAAHNAAVELDAALPA